MPRLEPPVAWIKTHSFIPTPTCANTQTFPALPHIQLLLAAPAHTWTATSSLATKAAAWSSLRPCAQPLLALPFPSHPCVCLSVCLSAALPPSSPLTPLLTCPPAPDEQSIWNVTVLPNSKWANITWKHNFGPGTDFVVEYIDSKHCCVGWWWRRRRQLWRVV